MEIALGKKCSPIYEMHISSAPIVGKRYRSSFEIIASILEAACEKISRFAIANYLKTNYMLLHKYLDYLVRIGFIDVEYDGKQIFYRTSQKGIEFLGLYYNLLKMLSDTIEAKVHVNIAYQRTNLRGG
ncbi:MAG: winged helix-turn-helix domain-containing protein [Candidatus Bathyarchaeia archaeon]